MYTMVFVFVFALVGTAWPSMLLAVDERPPRTSDAHERLTQVLGFDGGVQVYKDDEGNVTTTLHVPGGERRVTVQPPPSPSMNLGPPLQLHNPAFQLPQTVIPNEPSPPDFPQKAR